MSLNGPAPKDSQQIAEPNTILRGLVGSTIHGLGVDDGVDDRDEMGVCLEDVEYVIGLGAFEQWTFRTAEQRLVEQTGRPTVDGRLPKSGTGDLDLTVYSLRKFARLALQGNPTILNLLFVPPHECVVRDANGTRLQELAPAFASRQAGARYLGYLEAQRRRLTGERGQMNVSRPELVERYGFDTKYAMHMLRLGFQGVEYLRTGRLTLPMAEPARSYLRGVRLGRESFQAVLTRAGELERELKDLLETSPLPETPDTNTVETWMIRTYWDHWKAGSSFSRGSYEPEGRLPSAER